MQDVKMSKLSNDKLGKLYIAKFRIACYALNVLRYIIQKNNFRKQKNRGGNDEKRGFFTP